MPDASRRSRAVVSCHGANQLEYLFGVLDLSAALPPRHYGMLMQRVAAVLGGDIVRRFGEKIGLNGPPSLRPGGN